MTESKLRKCCESHCHSGSQTSRSTKICARYPHPELKYRVHNIRFNYHSLHLRVETRIEVIIVPTMMTKIITASKATAALGAIVSPWCGIKLSVYVLGKWLVLDLSLGKILRL